MRKREGRTSRKSGGDPWRTSSKGGAKVDERIRDLDHWFQFAEEIGQQRLYNFLWVASILLLACATILSSDKAPRALAIVLSIAGIIMSGLWWSLGSRQSKFHEKIDHELRQLLRVDPEPKRYAIFHIQNMKDNPDGQPKAARLNPIELFLSNRRFLWFVPVIFLIVFVSTFVIAIT